MAMFERLRKVDVRAVLSALGVHQSVNFQVRPREFLNGRWQGGTYIEVTRIKESLHHPGRLRFKIGALPPMDLPDAVQYINNGFDSYHAPRV